LDSTADPNGLNLGFLERSRYCFFQVNSSVILNEAEWTPFQTQYFAENLVAPGSNPVLWICSQEL
jgi:hypothetical protein